MYFIKRAKKKEEDFSKLYISDPEELKAKLTEYLRQQGIEEEPNYWKGGFFMLLAALGFAGAYAAYKWRNP